MAIFGFGKKERRTVPQIVDGLRGMVTELQSTKTVIATETTKVEETQKAEVEAHEKAMLQLTGEKVRLDDEATMCNDVITGLSNLLGSAAPVEETPAAE